MADGSFSYGKKNFLKFWNFEIRKKHGCKITKLDITALFAIKFPMDRVPELFWVTLTPVYFYFGVKITQSCVEIFTQKLHNYEIYKIINKITFDTYVRLMNYEICMQKLHNYEIYKLIHKITFDTYVRLMNYAITKFLCKFLLNIRQM